MPPCLVSTPVAVEATGTPELYLLTVFSRRLFKIHSDSKALFPVMFYLGRAEVVLSSCATKLIMCFIICSKGGESEEPKE